MVNSIDTSIYFKDPSTEIGSQYDFNKDGTVDIADYNLALVYLNDGDPENDVEFTKEHLESVFAGLIEQEDKNQNNEYDEITEDNVNDVSKKVIAAINSDATTPSKVTTLKELQSVGKALTKYIKECSTIADIYAKQIPQLKAQLDEITAEKAKKEEEYESKKDEVEEKTVKLAEVTNNILQKSNRLSEQRKERAKDIVKSCVTAYINGDYANSTLQEEISKQLANSGGFDVTDLQAAIANSKTLGAEISAICSDIDGLTEDIRTCNENYNTINTRYNSTVANRNGIVSAAQIASNKYQTGYQKRLDLRQDLIDKYYTAGTGERYSTSNAQVVKLQEFLNNKELDNMTFSDAVAVIKESFNDCGIKINTDTSGNVSFSVPYGHDSTARNIYAAFIQSIQDNFGVSSEVIKDKEEDEEEDDDDGYDDSTTPTLTTIARTDPISFTDGNIKYEFIQDRNGDGVFNDASEFLGSEAGWSEMSLYDTNGDGHISGDELKTLQLVGKNQTNGQFTFKTAEEAGISDIDLSSYKENTNEKLQINGNILDGSFSISMKDGTTKTGQQSYDTNKNLENEFKLTFGASINDTKEEMYDDNNPFMEDFEETIDTEQVSEESDNEISDTEDDSNNILLSAQVEIDISVDSDTREAEKEKSKIDEAKAEEAKKEEKKEEQKIADKKAEEAKEEEIAQAKKEEEKAKK